MTTILEDVIQRKAEATLIVYESKETSVTFDANRLKSIENTEAYGQDLQVIRDGKLGSAGSTQVGGEKELVDNAFSVAEFGSLVGYTFPGPETYAQPKVFDQRVSDVTVDEMIAIGEELVDFVKSLDSSINGAAQVQKGVSQVSVKNTKGVDVNSKKTVFAVTCGYQFVEGKNLLSSWDWQIMTSLQYDLESMKAKLKEDFEVGRKNVSIEPGLYDVLFTPAAFSDIVNPIMACIDGRAVMRGISPFAGRLGEEIFAPSFSLIEDGTLCGAVGSGPCDEQGVPCRRTPLIDEGVLSEYLLDLESAHRLGRKPIGTGTRTGARPNNVIVPGGNASFDDLMAGMKRGIIIDQTMGAWAGNPYTGTVTGNIALGYLVEDGKKVGRIKDCMFSLNVFSHLKSNLLALTKETKSLGGLILPYCLIGGVSISGRN